MYAGRAWLLPGQAGIASLCELDRLAPYQDYERHRVAVQPVRGAASETRNCPQPADLGSADVEGTVVGFAATRALC